MLQRIRTLMHRRLTAGRFGLRFQRQKTFRLPACIKAVGTSPLYIPPDQESLTADFVNVILDDEYGTSLLQTPPTTVVDIGANIGLFSWLALHSWPEAKIFAFEPNPSAYEFLQKNAAGASPANCAVGLQPGHVDIGGEAQWRMGTVNPSRNGGIEMISLAQCLKLAGGEIDFAKMDIEGFEWSLFEDTDSFKNIKRLHMEYHLVNGRTQTEFESVVKDLGYVIDRISNMGDFGIAWLYR